MTPIDFLKALFGPYEDQAKALNLGIEIRSFPPAWDTQTIAAVYDPQPGTRRVDCPRRWFCLHDAGYERCVAFTERICAEWDVYYGVLPRVRGGGRAEHLRLAGWLYVDMDAGEEGPQEALNLLAAQVKALGLPAPAVLVRSGRGIHAYWKLAAPVTLRTRDEQERFRRVLQRLVRAIGGELEKAHACPKATDCARVLRVPGTFNLKQQDKPRPVYVLRLDPNADAQPLLWWEAHLPSLPLPPRRSPAPSGGRGGWGKDPAALTERLLDRLMSSAQDGEKHYRLVDAAVFLRKKDQPEDVIRAVLVQKAVNSGVSLDYQQQRHIDQIVSWTFDHVQPDYAA